MPLHGPRQTSPRCKMERNQPGRKHLRCQPPSPQPHHYLSSRSSSPRLLYRYVVIYLPETLDPIWSPLTKRRIRVLSTSHLVCSPPSAAMLVPASIPEVYPFPQRRRNFSLLQRQGLFFCVFPCVRLQVGSLNDSGLSTSKMSLRRAP